MSALTPLAEHGLSVRTDGNALVVTPAKRLTDDVRNYIRSHKPELLNLVKSWEVLELAIHACCDARGDRDHNREELIADCRHELATDRPWRTEYFTSEAARWTH